VRFQLAVRLPRPRVPDSAEVRTLVDEVYALMTAGSTRVGRAVAEPAPIDLAERLPAADVARMEGLLEMLQGDEFAGRADLPKLAELTELTDDELLPLVQALSLLDLSRVADGDVHVTPLGRQYVDGSYTQRQAIFGRQLLAHVPLVAHIRHSLDQEPAGALAEELFLRLLRESLDPAEAEAVMRTAIEWGRHGEVFEYDFHTGLIHLREEESEAAAVAQGEDE
jgi:NitT/TauT family transport system ATP-binding protein